MWGAVRKRISSVRGRTTGRKVLSVTGIQQGSYGLGFHGYFSRGLNPKDSSRNGSEAREGPLSHRVQPLSIIIYRSMVVLMFMG